MLGDDSCYIQSYLLCGFLHVCINRCLHSNVERDVGEVCGIKLQFVVCLDNVRQLGLSLRTFTLQERIQLALTECWRLPRFNAKAPLSFNVNTSFVVVRGLCRLIGVDLIWLDGHALQHVLLYALWVNVGCPL